MDQHQKVDLDQEVHDKCERKKELNMAVCPSRRLVRPSERELMNALVAYRQFPTSPVQRDALGILIHRSIATQARSLAANFFSAADGFEDELCERANQRIQNKEKCLGQLLADYEIAEGSRGIYGFINEMTQNIARNMQSEMYVPDGGFSSKDLIATLEDNQFEKTGKRSLRSGTQALVAIATQEDDDDGYAGNVPQGLWTSETPMRESFIRVNSLTQKLSVLAADMVGKSLTMALDDGMIARKVRLTANHSQIWLAWLGLLDAGHLDLSEEELANQLGISKPTVTRHTSAAFAYMLQRSDLHEILELMKPNSFQVIANHCGEPDTTLTALEGVLRGPSGKGFFRTCVHRWLADHV